ncbi:hypothetical protein KKH39_00810 [Patescibacteria group bacterium]|nr:hypothetical protein [Patescibacteria group bacterium]
MTLFKKRAAWRIGPFWFFWINMGYLFGKIEILEDKIKIIIPFKTYEIKKQNILAIEQVKSIKEKGLYYRQFGYPMFRVQHNDPRYKNIKFFFSLGGKKNTQKSLLMALKKAKIKYT